MYMLRHLFLFSIVVAGMSLAVLGQTSQKYSGEYADLYRAEELFGKEQYSAARKVFQEFITDYFEKRVGRESFVSAFVFVGMGLTKENDEIDSRGQRHPPPIAHNRSRTKADDIRATKFRPRLKKPPNVLSYPREYRFSAREKTTFSSPTNSLSKALFSRRAQFQRR